MSFTFDETDECITTAFLLYSSRHLAYSYKDNIKQFSTRVAPFWNQFVFWHIKTNEAYDECIVFNVTWTNGLQWYRFKCPLSLFEINASHEHTIRLFQHAVEIHRIDSVSWPPHRISINCVFVCAQPNQVK